jgi:periplasmic protein TonB
MGVTRLSMLDEKEPKIHEPAFLAAAALSIAAHCIGAAVLMQFVRGETVVLLPQIITVDIRNPLPAEKTAPVLFSRPARNARERREPVPVREVRRDTLPSLKPERSVNQPAMATLSPADREPVQETPVPLSAFHHESSRADGSTHSAAQPKGSNTQAVTLPADGARVIAAYLARLRELIARQKAYPVTARRGNLQGTVRIRCVLARSGEVITVAINGSSGHEILDNAALRAVWEAGRFPEVPAGITGATFAFEVPVVFRLAGD